MAPATLSPPGPARRRPAPPREAPSLFDDAAPLASAPATAPPVATLADSLALAWSELTAGSGEAACPACGGHLARRWSAGAGVVGGRCEGCGTSLE